MGQVTNVTGCSGYARAAPVKAGAALGANGRKPTNFSLLDGLPCLALGIDLVDCLTRFRC
jgi:hypothetical protein